jgi:hypothetical protein
MNGKTKKLVVVVLRIAGCWPDREALAAGLPPEHVLTDQYLRLPDGTQVECCLRPADQQFASVFRTACRGTASPAELETVDHYRFNCCLIGAAGTLAGAQTMLRAGAAIVRAGGGGVFIDNSCLAHGGSAWLEMADDNGPDAISYAFVNIIQGAKEAWTAGLHVLGMPDLTIRTTDIGSDREILIDTLRYMAEGHLELADGHFLANEQGLSCQIQAADGDHFAKSSPMHNPFGRLRLVRCHALPSAG